MTNDTIEQDFRAKVSAKVRLASEGVDRYRVFTPFRFDDGDHLSIVLKKVGTQWALSDEAHTYMHLTYDIDESDLHRGNRQKIISNALSIFHVEDRDGELTLGVKDDHYGDALYSFIQALLKISDVSYLSRERVRSTFMDDFRSFLPSRSRKIAGLSIGTISSAIRRACIRLTVGSTAWRGRSSSTPCTTTARLGTLRYPCTDSKGGSCPSVPWRFLKIKRTSTAKCLRASPTWAKSSSPASQVIETGSCDSLRRRCRPPALTRPSNRGRIAGGRREGNVVTAEGLRSLERTLSGLGVLQSPSLIRRRRRRIGSHETT